MYVLFPILDIFVFQYLPLEANMDQEILLEQIINYSIGASEIIPDIGQKAKEDYQIAILPYGQYFYTGILQSAGYLLLADKKKCLLVIQQANENEVYQLTWSLGTILGQPRTCQSHDSIRKTISPSSTKNLWMIRSHLAYIWTITDMNYINCLIVGEQLSPTKQKKLNDYITDICSDHNIIFLMNIRLPQNDKGFLFSQVVQNNKGTSIKSFSNISKRCQRKPEIIAYTDGDKKGDGGYACIMA